METIELNDFDLTHMEKLRVALSEGADEQRLRAAKNVRLIAVTSRII